MKSAHMIARAGGAQLRAKRAADDMNVHRACGQAILSISARTGDDNCEPTVMLTTECKAGQRGLARHMKEKEREGGIPRAGGKGLM